MEDKLPPVIQDPDCQCPEGNTDPSCRLPSLCIDLLTSLDADINVPKPTAIDNCTDVIVTFEDNVVPGNTCDETIIKRTWIFTDENGNAVRKVEFPKVVEELSGREIPLDMMG